MRALFAALLLGACATSPYAPEAPITIDVEQARFAPIVPNKPELGQIAVLRGDPNTGPSDMLMRLPRGEGRLHTHTADYTLVVVRGEMRHWRSAEDRAQAQPMGPGSYWLQPGGEPHADDCLSDECLMFIAWRGPRDAALAD